jgi:hypothetical protein
MNATASTTPAPVNTITLEFGMTFTAEMLAFMGATREDFRAVKPLYIFSEFRQVWTARTINGRHFVTREDGRLDRALIMEFASRDDLRAYETYLRQPTNEGKWL